MKIFDSLRKRKLTVHQLHHFIGKMSSAQQVGNVKLDELNEEIASEDSKYNLRYFEDCHQTKQWLVKKEDFNIMYTCYSLGSDFFAVRWQRRGG